MRVIHTVPHVGNEASGPTYVVTRLAQSIAAMGNKVSLYSVKDGLISGTEHFQHRVFPKAHFLSKFWRSPELYQALIDGSKSADILHSHSLWVMPNVYPGWAAKKCQTPLVLTPHGTLSEWALSRSALKKKLFWYILQKRVVERAVCLHATSEGEYLDIRRVGLKQPICIIPNGIDIPNVLSKKETSSDKQPVQRTLLYLGRLHPVKGVDLLINAWSEVAHSRPEWQLRIVGPDEGGYMTELKSLASSLRAQRVRFVGPAFGLEKELEYQRADLYILPTHSENFGVTVAESLANGTPVITTKNAPWEGLLKYDCGWWIDLTPEQLKQTLMEATALNSSDLKVLGSRGRRWMSDKYDWPVIANQMADVYRWLISGGAPPKCVGLD